MKKVIRLTERDLTRIVKKVIKEEEFSSEQSSLRSNLPDCNQFTMIDKRPGGSTDLIGPFDRIRFPNSSLPPQFRNFIVFRKGKPFCTIKK